jgi:hypothetical protein
MACPSRVEKITNSFLSTVNKWQIGDKGTRHDATLHLRAPFDPENARIRGVYE